MSQRDGRLYFDKNSRANSNQRQTHVVVDKNLRRLDDDPRVDSNNVKRVKKSGGGRNTESFDPKSTLVRPDMRVLITPNQPILNQAIKHDDVIIVPDFFCKQDDWDIYYRLVEEMRDIQADRVKGSEWISWHEGAHLISKNPSESKIFREIQQKISTYFGINNHNVGTRFNWYRDSTDWKPFHHDSAAYNPQRAKSQNITVGVSFGATRELSFLHAKNGTKIYFPQTNGMMFSFGRDVNINWKHGVNALHETDQDGKGRISIVLWGLCPKFTEEENSPQMLLDNTSGNGHNMHNANGHGHNSSRNNAQRIERPLTAHAPKSTGRRDDSRERRGGEHERNGNDKRNNADKHNGSHHFTGNHSSENRNDRDRPPVDRHERSDRVENSRVTDASGRHTDRPARTESGNNHYQPPNRSNDVRSDTHGRNEDRPRSQRIEGQESSVTYVRRDASSNQTRPREDSRERQSHHNSNVRYRDDNGRRERERGDSRDRGGNSRQGENRRQHDRR